MKKIIASIISIIVIIFLLLILLIPKQNFSDNENRFLEVFPKISISSIVSGDFQSKMCNYISDHFPLREKLLGFKNKIDHFLGISRINNVYYSKDNYLIEEYNKPKNNYKISRIINRFIENNSNKKIDFMLVPTSALVYDNKLPKYNISNSENDTIEFYKDNLKLNFIDVRDNLIKHNNEYIYYKTDHHWTTLGAYYAYEEYCNVNNLTKNIFRFVKVDNNFRGTLYSKILDNSIEMDYIIKVDDDNKYQVIIDNNQTNSFYDYSYLRKKDKYSYFFGGNKGLITITNDNGKDELLVIKDSYANNFIPFIAKNYKKIYVIDPRYYNESIEDFIDNKYVSNILFVYNVLTIDDDIGILSINR